MKKNIHPVLTKTLVVQTDGSTYELSQLSTRKQLKLDVDPRSHLLWNPGLNKAFIEEKGQIAKFQKRFKLK